MTFPQQNSTWIPRLLILIGLFCCLTLITPDTSMALVNQKISGEMPAFGDVDPNSTVWEISPNGQTVVYIADQQFDGVMELYSTPINGSSPPVKISSSADVINFEISSDSQRVVYRTSSASGQDIYSTPIDQNANVQLNKQPILSNGGDNLLSFKIGPDNSNVLFVADHEITGVFELFSVPLTGGTVTKLSGTLVAEGDVNTFHISPDNDYVVYRADQDSDDVFEIYSVPLAGGAITKLNGPLATSPFPGSGGDVTYFEISPNSARVVYRADQETDDVFELYSVPIGGGVASNLNGALVTDGDVSDSLSFKISPDSARVIYKADQETDEVFELFSVPIGGGTATKLNGELVPNPLFTGADVFTYSISPDSARVVYHTVEQPSFENELYSVPINGGTATKLNGTLVTGGDVIYDFHISPDGSRVVYRADQEVDEVLELYSVPIAGGAATKLNDTLVTNGDISSSVLQITPDSANVIYRADQETDEVLELYSVPITGGTTAKLSGTLVADGDVGYLFRVSSDNTRVVYVADQETDEVHELFVSNISFKVYLPMVVK